MADVILIWLSHKTTQPLPQQEVTRKMGDLFNNYAVKPMMIGSVSTPYNDAESIFETNLCGERCMVFIDNGGPVLVNKRGLKMMERLPELAGIQKQVSGKCILDGEVIAAGHKDRHGALVKKRLLANTGKKIEQGKQEMPVTLLVADILYLNGRRLTTLPLMERKKILDTTVRNSEQLRKIEYTEKNGVAFYEQLPRTHTEGAVGKHMHSLYFPGKHSPDWTAIKALVDEDFIVCGYMVAEPAATLLLGQYDNKGCLKYKGRIALGANTTDFQIIKMQPHTSGPPFLRNPLPPPGNENVQWLEPQSVITAYLHASHQQSPKELPLYKGLQPGKNPREVIFTTE